MAAELGGYLSYRIPYKSSLLLFRMWENDCVGVCGLRRDQRAPLPPPPPSFIRS